MLTVPMYASIGHLDSASPEAHSITPPEPLSAETTSFVPYIPTNRTIPVQLGLREALLGGDENRRAHVPHVKHEGSAGIP
ncbi:hypothetical protein Q7C36_005660 [Tachysurus vachellii]|uniref:Uncharacterized protein n=1 Tax=Tachysurus vachellii TaxID=175792 RepID=A0AA88T0H4_TACVA|nr:hypothetical protein Q7C36_005660 [Tachysurus vachellii]